MKIFSIVMIVLGLTITVFSILGGNFLQIFSSISTSLGFIFYYYYSKNKSKKFLNLFIAFLAISVVLNSIGIFTEKDYF